LETCYISVYTRLFYFFSRSVTNQLHQRAAGASSINAFKECLSKIRETRMSFFMDWSANP